MMSTEIMENEDKKIIQKTFNKVKKEYKLKCNIETIEEIENYKIKVTIDISEEEYNNYSAILEDKLANIEYLCAEDFGGYVNGKLILIYTTIEVSGISVTRKDASLPDGRIF